MTIITDRLYQSAWSTYLAWCAQRQKLSEEVYDHTNVAAYLVDCLANRGPSAVPVHLSAIGKVFRREGLAFDTKSPGIQIPVSAARKQTRQRDLRAR